MGTKRQYRLKGRKPGSVASSAVLAWLAHESDLDTTARLACRMGTPPFDAMTKDEAVSEMHRLWPLHREAAIAACIKRCGAGYRPTLWWIHDVPNQRPYVRECDLTKDGDLGRYEKERRASDLAYLQQNNLLSEEEVAMLEAKKPKRFGPEEVNNEIA